MLVCPILVEYRQQEKASAKSIIESKKFVQLIKLFINGRQIEAVPKLISDGYICERVVWTWLVI